MSRLTNDLRDAIARAAVAHAFDPKKEALATQEDALAREAYAVIIPQSETALVAAVPENWFRLDECLRFNAGGYNVTLSLIGQGLPVPYRPRGGEDEGYHCHRLGSIPPGDLCDRVRAHVEEKETYKSERSVAHRAVTNLLHGVTTMKRLKEVWPQGEQFFDPYRNAPVASLPAVRVDEVNAMLGIAA